MSPNKQVMPISTVIYCGRGIGLIALSFLCNSLVGCSLDAPAVVSYPTDDASSSKNAGHSDTLSPMGGNEEPTARVGLDAQVRPAFVVDMGTVRVADMGNISVIDASSSTAVDLGSAPQADMSKPPAVDMGRAPEMDMGGMPNDLCTCRIPDDECTILERPRPTEAGAFCARAGVPCNPRADLSRTLRL